LIQFFLLSFVRLPAVKDDGTLHWDHFVVALKNTTLLRILR